MGLGLTDCQPLSTWSQGTVRLLSQYLYCLVEKLSARLVTGRGLDSSSRWLGWFPLSLSFSVGRLWCHLPFALPRERGKKAEDIKWGDI